MPAQAQVIPDESLGTINAGGVISGGLTTSNGAQQNLFHSFQEFSLDSTDTVTFIAPDSIENIVTRVTGPNLSRIDGTLQVSNTTSNLFLINPAGIVFGPNAQLRVPGSFIASTAEQATFANGFTLETERLNVPPLMTISAPTGLQIGKGAIQVQNTGHTLAKLNPLDPSRGANGGLAPHIQQGATSGLQVRPGKTLALIGNGITLNGGQVTAHSGHVEIGSVSQGSSVSLNPLNFTADYGAVEAFSSVQFVNRSLANVSGVPVALLPALPSVQLFTTHQGSLQVSGHDINLQDSSILLGQTGVAATQSGNSLTVNAAGTLLISGSEASSSLRSGVFSETLGPQPSGNIDIQAAQLQIQEGAGIVGFTFSEANGGAIQIRTDEQLAVSGFNAINPLISSTIATGTIASTGNSGDLRIKSPQLLLEGGGSISSLTFGLGESGSLSVYSDDIRLTGRSAVSNIPSSIAASNFGPGLAGNIDIETKKLSLADRALIAASSISAGSAGNIRIVATDSIEINQPIGSEPSSAINSSVFIPSDFERALFNISPDFIPTGDSGNLSLITPHLRLSGPVQINVKNGGLGNAGEAQIQANSVSLTDGGGIIAFTEYGNGGNIKLQLADSLLLQNGSRLTVESNGPGNGGNIDISSPIIIAQENSDITANARLGNGGNINISTEHILGTAFRPQTTSESDITASSAFGLNGSVNINSLDLTTTQNLVQLPDKVAGSHQDKVIVGCVGQASDQFVASGKGGFPHSPTQILSSQNVWKDFRVDPLAPSITPQLEKQRTGDSQIEWGLQQSSNASFEEAEAWHLDEEGRISLLASSPVMSEAVRCLKRKAASAV